MFLLIVWAKSQLVSWYFEASQPQRITSALNQTSMCLLFTLHTRHQTTNFPNTIKSVPTQIYIKQDTHKQQMQNFRGINPFGIAPVKKKKKAHKARTRWCRGPFRQFINTRFKKKG